MLASRALYVYVVSEVMPILSIASHTQRVPLLGRLSGVLIITEAMMISSLPTV